MAIGLKFIPYPEDWHPILTAYNFQADASVCLQEASRVVIFQMVLYVVGPMGTMVMPPLP